MSIVLGPDSATLPNTIMNLYDEFQVKWFGVALKNRGLESVSWLVRSVKLELPCQILTRHVF